MLVLPFSYFNLRLFPSFTFPKFGFNFAESFNGKNATENPRFKRILWVIIAGTRGGVNRAKILNLLKDSPMNAHQVASNLNLDYKTVVHHVKMLRKNELIVKKTEESYGAIYILTQAMQDNITALEEIMAKIGTK